MKHCHTITYMSPLIYSISNHKRFLMRTQFIQNIKIDHTALQFRLNYPSIAKTLNSHQTLCLLTISKKKIAQVNPSNDNNILRLHTMSQVLFTSCMPCSFNFFYIKVYIWWMQTLYTTEPQHKYKEEKNCITANLRYCGFQCKV